ncbi:uncharacterized protein LOC116307062 isoform X1 [Actinia tenebrosa]|uniref:Uncharacterized protein LOC116307062 isoform X1 n=1 Tax=Actinia tenebrosa TaxID=6105 RepID=A0A6P8J0P2_ACTTE|nr:uncharacterized protein LOC116307062 isoform X1 [Actinia tenebrosa]
MSNGHPNKEDPQNTVSNHGKVEGLDKHGSVFHPSAGPVFKVLEAPEYAEVNNPKEEVKNRPYFDSAMYNKKVEKAQKPNSQKEPLYNVLEDPGSLNEPLEGRQAPCYQVLEGPFPEGAPLYDVIAQPPSSDNQ